MLVIWGFVSLVLVLGGRPTQDSTAVLDVCDVMKDPALFDGKVIMVRGVARRGHGLYLFDCHTECAKTDKERPLGAFFVVGTESSFFIQEAGVSTTFVTGPSFGSLVDELYRSERQEALVTVEGQVESKPGRGYGQLWLSPAMLIVKTVHKVKVRPFVLPSVSCDQ